MSLNSSAALQPGQVYTFYFNPSGAILGAGYAPSGQELATAIASNVPDTENVSGGISSTLDVYGPAWITFTYTGDGSDTAGSFASELENALNGSFLTTSYAFTQASEGAPSSSNMPNSTSWSTWILVGILIAVLLATGIFFMVRR